MEQNSTPLIASQPNSVKPTSAPHTLIILLAILILSLLGSTVYLAFQNYQLRKIIGKPSTSPFPTSSPISDPTADWETYTVSSSRYSFKYPPTFTPSTISIEGVRSSKYESLFVVLATDQPQGIPLQCHKIIFSEETILDNHKVTKKLLHGITPDVNSPLNCTLANSYNYMYRVTLREDENTMDVLDLEFDNSEFPPEQATILLDQILSTFKFTDSNTVTDYKCPASGWVNCMPILTPEAQKACTKEAIAWYNANCPNFQGVAQ